VGCVLLFLLKVGDSCAANRYQPLPPATVTKRGFVAYLLARVGVLPVFLAKRKSAGLKSLPLRQSSRINHIEESYHYRELPNRSVASFCEIAAVPDFPVLAG
jgi:hypothetical protein